MQNTPIHILLADDDEDDRMLFTDAFNEIKIKTKVSTVVDGQELLEYMQQPDAELPNILFLDLNMPRKNGMQCLEEIKKEKRFDDIAIVIYSTSASESDVEETFVKGANIYIKKPNDFNQLKSILNEVVTINWQYQTCGLSRDNFLLNLQ